MSCARAKALPGLSRRCTLTLLLVRYMQPRDLRHRQQGHLGDERSTQLLSIVLDQVYAATHGNPPPFAPRHIADGSSPPLLEIRLPECTQRPDGRRSLSQSAVAHEGAPEAGTVRIVVNEQRDIVNTTLLPNIWARTTRRPLRLHTRLLEQLA